MEIENTISFFEKTVFMKELVNECVNLIIKDNVDEVTKALRDTYFWYIKKEFSTQEKYKDALDKFLECASRTLMAEHYKRVTISEDEISKLHFRNSSQIAKLIQEMMAGLEKIDGIIFLGELNGAYVLSVPEPLFRVARIYLGLHETAYSPAIDDNLPMSDEMILYAWSYDWFYSWLGY
ncbi:MAG: hypothetical protein U0Z26_17945 [Anaerolineales bacterium]